MTAATCPVLKWASVEYYPQAKCDDCDWGRPAGRDTRQMAKDHVRNNRGHEVTVDVVKRHTYWSE